MYRSIYVLISAVLLSLPVNSHALFNKNDPAEERQELQDARKEALAQLYEEKPSARQEIEEAVGYAVFSSLGVNVLLVSTENGGGILHDNRDGKDLYMKMFSAGGGIGMGSKVSAWFSSSTRRKRSTISRTPAGIFPGRLTPPRRQMIPE